MGSILIKPVQRVLKYPLIVNELIKYTEENHEDRCDLIKAASAMMDVAKDINENKRRKDIVIKYLEDNPLTISSRISRMTLHSVAKKSNRIGALLSSSLGIKTGARDELYDEQESLFYNLDKMVRSFLKNAETFVASLQETFFIKGLIVENIVSLYDEDTTTEVDMYCKIVKNISSQFLNEFKRTFESRVSIPLSMLLKCFEGPWKLVQKRYDKLLDYEAFFSRMDKTKDNRQGTINIMKNTFIALNNQLTEELPLLITLACEVFSECVKAFVLARKLLMGKITKQYLALFSEIYEDNHFNDESLDTFVTKHTLAWSQLINLPSLTRQPKYDGGVGSTYKFFPLSATDSVSASIASTGMPMTSQQAYLHSYYDISSLYQVIENYNAKENLELTVSEGQLVAVIKKQNPMGDPKIWFVDNGATQGFVPSSCLILLHNDAVGQSVIDQATDQKVQLPDISHGSTKQGLYETSDEADNPPSYATVVSSGVNEENEPFYEEVKDDELFYVLHDLTSSDDHVLKASRGQVVKVLHKEDYDGNSEWWFVEDNLKNTGYVPANYLSKCNFN
ncbi:dynamin-binding protein-like isoform X2 [Bacillus rossius redtenbacheri]